MRKTGRGGGGWTIHSGPSFARLYSSYMHALQIEKIKLPSEDNPNKKDNPIDGVRFYKKPTGDGSRVVTLSKKEVEEMVI